MTKPLIFLLAGLAATTGANAAEWVKIHTPAENSQFYYDKTKLFIHGSEITYWKKAVFAVPQPFKDKLAGSGLYRERIHCAEHTLKLVSYLLYAPSGEVAEYVSTAEGEAAPIIPDSLGDVFEKHLCPLVRQKQEEEARLKAEAAKAEAAKEEARLRAEAEAEAARTRAPETAPAPPSGQPQQ